jgi:PERQ amino acid-rich with GYF domain-containing protein
VGPNGKSAVLTQPSRPPAQTSFSSAVSSPSAVIRSAAPPNQRIATASPTKIKPVITKPSEAPEAPSLEFLKWLGESLKGLNSSANGKSFVYTIEKMAKLTGE